MATEDGSNANGECPGYGQIVELAKGKWQTTMTPQTVTSKEGPTTPQQKQNITFLVFE